MSLVRLPIANWIFLKCGLASHSTGHCANGAMAYDCGLFVFCGPRRAITTLPMWHVATLYTKALSFSRHQVLVGFWCPGPKEAMRIALSLHSLQASNDASNSYNTQKGFPKVHFSAKARRNERLCSSVARQSFVPITYYYYYTCQFFSVELSIMRNAVPE